MGKLTKWVYGGPGRWTAVDYDEEPGIRKLAGAIRIVDEGGPSPQPAVASQPQPSTTAPPPAPSPALTRTTAAAPAEEKEKGLASAIKIAGRPKPSKTGGTKAELRLFVGTFGPEEGCRLFMSGANYLTEAQKLRRRLEREKARLEREFAKASQPKRGLGKVVHIRNARRRKG